MPDDNVVLATRVLSYMKRKSGPGSPPSQSEAKAAITALTLLTTTFPNLAGDTPAMFQKLKEIARKAGGGQSDKGQSLGTGSDMQTMKMQMQMQKQQEATQMMSNLLKKQHEMKSSIISNLR